MRRVRWGAPAPALMAVLVTLHGMLVAWGLAQCPALTPGSGEPVLEEPRSPSWGRPGLGEGASVASSAGTDGVSGPQASKGGGTYTCPSSIQHIVTISLLDSKADWQLGCFAVATVAWILTTMSMGFVEWRMWYMDGAAQHSPGLVYVGVWKVCVYHRDGSLDGATLCHRYAYRDTYLPLNIRVSQHLLLAASILGLLGKAVMVCALSNVYVTDFHLCATYHLITLSGFMNIAAGILLSIAATWNYCAVMNKEGISFPPSFSVPFKPDTQGVGNAFLAACLAAVLSLSCGMFFLLSKTPQSNKVHPRIWEI